MSTSTPAVADLSPDELRAFAERAGAELEGAHPAEILAWAGRTFGTDLVVASSMGDEVLVDLAAKAVPGVEVIFLDTGYHFAETLGTRDYYAEFTDIRLRTVLPLRTVAEQDAEHGPRPHERDPNLCCALRKVEPLERGLAPYTAWVTGMRREDAPTRTDITVVGWDARRSKVKLNPLAAWTQDDLEAYVAEHHVVLNPLRQIGYTSIGCAPCTRATAPGEDPRAGRWSGTSKTECGLHT
ncbi:phosphoadenylyl-sulfate reductase [Cellulomonas fimi]|uniref:Adenosine 5'-phosphosulfate reductase n=1 Tax=Cellulomonas fimi (strain ATCC 484 / DSM 20113 / JCM 1341 / CCUG 24087 / LMG 16345 / NBRC 15513 / NCIMB 8980 / NCTC 7547 / NRS-133) TaxID=590998 RepID=F4H0Z6_CELFA|nr:phosphoadenylyl-sulfate reductase [Cellulomonas fimi]AEE46243.1 phosphoadenosine phosphosulfate reductase [Cellulomonas fimi ATCC 484]NNH06182.1 phosphoadenylyl-sulfate reductase [Cellulomonas fimi]VEH32205.1 Phosphoadenosine phosphosulfate reductase [Cellulomonas fimi]